MSLLVLGLSHHGAAIDLLEEVALDDAGCLALADAALAGEHVGECVVVSTCNRTELYAESATFHGAVSDLVDALAAATGVDRQLLREHLYVHYDERAVAHAFRVACGLDSMAVGEAQILGQLRHALTRAQRHEHVSTGLNALFQHALRVGKRAHAETGLDHVSHTLVDAGLVLAREVLGELAGRTVLILGAGGMSGLAAATVATWQPGRIVVVTRTASRGVRLAERVGGTSRPMAELPAALAEADLVIASAGAVGVLVDHDSAALAAAAREHRTQVYLDLALPHDVTPAVAGLDGVTRISLADLGRLLRDDTHAGPTVERVEALVVAEVAVHLTTRAASSVAPTVAALRARAADVVAAELERLAARTPELSRAERAEVDLAVHRVVEKLLHTPTTRVKQLAGTGQGAPYAAALTELFDLAPTTTALVERTSQLPQDQS